MTDTPHLDLPVIDVLAQKHLIANDAFAILDALVMLAVLDRDLTAPPVSPADGDRYLVKAAGTGLFAGHDNEVAHFTAGDWSFYTPRAGWICYVSDEALLLTWDGAAWAGLARAIGDLQNLALLGVGTTADSANPFSAKLNGALWVAKTVAEGGDGTLRYKLSKESSAKTLSFLFQDNFSGRAEIGLTGDDDFHFKVSPDGSAWIESLVLSKSTGAAAITSAGSAALAVGPSGATNPGLLVDASTASSATGIKVKSAAAGGCVTVGAISSGANEGLMLEAKGSGTITLNGTGTGNVTTPRALAVSNTTAATSTTSGAVTVGGGLGVAGKAYIGDTLDLSTNSAGIHLNISATNNHIKLSDPGGGAACYVYMTGGDGKLRLYSGGDQLTFSSAGAYVTNKLGFLSATIETNYVLELPNNAAQKAKANAWDVYSDGRLKANRAAIVDPIGLVMAMRPRMFDQHDHVNDEQTGEIKLQPAFKRTFGFIAQDEEKTVPWLVTPGSDKHTWSFDYGKLSTLCIAGLQDHEARLRRLEARIAALESSTH